jgi:hypothetical protein
MFTRRVLVLELLAAAWSLAQDAPAIRVTGAFGSMKC